MSLLAVTAVLAIGIAMWFYFREYELQMPAPVRERLVQLSKDPQQNADQIWQIFRDNYDVRDYLPGFPSEDWLVLIELVALSIPFIIAAGLFASLSMSRQFTSLANAARKVHDGDFSVQLSEPPRVPRELSELISNFNAMTRKLAQYERELSESSAMLAHELRTPLHAAMGRLQAIVDDVFPLDLEQVRSVHSQLEQINRLVADMHTVSLGRAGQLALEPHWFRLEELVAERREWARLSLTEAQIRVIAIVSPGMLAYGDRDRIGQCISILIDNCVRYAADGGLLEIDARRADGFIQIAFNDLGPGVDEQSLPRLVDRFWRAEGSRSRHLGGSGLGLAIAAAICHAHGGWLECKNRPGCGLSATLILPDGSS